jgi:hypothetical protein
MTPCNRVNPCLFYPEWRDYHIRFFDPAISDETNSVSPFFYTMDLFFGAYDYDDSVRTGLAQQEALQNDEEWKRYLGGTPEMDDIQQLIDKSAPDVFLTAYTLGDLEAAFPGNTCVKALLRADRRAALEYVAFIKQFEFEQDRYEDPWKEHDYSNWHENDTLDMVRLADRAEAALSVATDPFLKKRWAYQGVTANYYADRKDRACALFDQYFSLKDKTVLMPWALMKRAEMEKNKGKRNLFFAKAFALSPSRRIRAVQLFSSAHTDQAMPFAQTRRDKATVLTMRAVQNPGRAWNDLREVARLDPEGPWFRLLLVREINKLEDWLLSYSLTNKSRNVDHWLDSEWDNPNRDEKIAYLNRKNIEKDQLYLQKVLQLVTEKAQSPKCSRRLRHFLSLSAAHLCYLSHQGEKGQYWLQQVRNTPQQPLLAVQYHIESVLLLPLLNNIEDRRAQAALMQHLDFIWANVQYLTNARKQMAQLYRFLSWHFYQKKNIGVAALLFNRSLPGLSTNFDRDWNSVGNITFLDNYAKISDLDRLAAFCQKKRKTKFEQWVISAIRKDEYDPENSGFYSDTAYARYLLPVTSDQIFDLRGTFALRDGHLSVAASSFKQVNPDFWEKDKWTNLGWDFFGKKDSLPFARLDSLPANKLRLVQRLMDLEKEAIRNPKRRAENYYLMANAYFQMTCWGQGWEMMACGIGEEKTVRKRPKKFLKLYSSPDPARYAEDFYQCKKAMRYYQKCLESHPEPEMGSRAAFMLGECDRRRIWAEKEPVNKPLSPFFRTWGARYKNTAFYAEQIRTCPNLKDFLGL